MIDFWVSVGSTYSYLTVMRLRTVEKETGVKFRWRPFSVRAIMMEQKNIPFVGKPVKYAYMWRDIERRARERDFEPRLPAPYPLKEFDLANRVAIVGEAEGWCADYIEAAYRRWFHSGDEPGCEPGLSDALREIGQKSPPASSRLPRATRPASATSRRPRRPRRSASSARRPSWSTLKSSGATTVSRTRLAGASARVPRAPDRPLHSLVNSTAACAGSAALLPHSKSRRFLWRTKCRVDRGVRRDPTVRSGGGAR